MRRKARRCGPACWSHLIFPATLEKDGDDPDIVSEVDLFALLIRIVSISPYWTQRPGVVSSLTTIGKIKEVTPDMLLQLGDPEDALVTCQAPRNAPQYAMMFLMHSLF